MRTYQLRLWRAGDEDVVAAGNEVGGAINVGVAAGGNAITDETSVVLYAELVEEVKGLTDELNGWVTDDVEGLWLACKLGIRVVLLEMDNGDVDSDGSR
ncbi:hypothetical protein V6N12_073874 [Hibiscus sabdariffa]|uniref:RNase H type-1 domain-containing protein n=1 Tax=Hibiscus sabdariffa TaxID=183260 RepID=A0ABR1ZKN5_9ROSI